MVNKATVADPSCLAHATSNTQSALATFGGAGRISWFHNYIGEWNWTPDLMTGLLLHNDVSTAYGKPGVRVE